MIIHSDTLVYSDFDAAATAAGVDLQGFNVKGSYSRARAFNVTLSGSGRNGGMYGNLGYPTATWDEWGIVLAHLFNVDSAARVPRVYEGAEQFHWATGDRYRTLTRDAAHVKHNWLSGDTNGQSAGGAYYVQSCKCGALLRRLASGYRWEDICENA
jgi:hypothetical protein